MMRPDNVRYSQFDDLRIDKFRLMTLNCFNLENSYERAAKVHAVNGTILSGLAILGGVFLIFSGHRLPHYHASRMSTDLTAFTR